MNSLSDRMKWLAGSVLLAALTACGGGGSEESGGATPTPTPTPIPSPAALAPTITTQPASVAMTAGAAATFSVAGSGTAPLTYQWQRDGKDIAGATSAIYTLPSTDMPDSGVLFTVVVSNTAGSVKSNAAVLTVNSAVIAPTLIVQPQSASTLDGGTVTFSVAATGTEPFIYQWKRNGTDITSATAASYTTPVLTLADTGAVYTVTVANSTATAPSGSATLTVKPVPPSVIDAPAAVAVSVGQTVTFSLTAEGSAPLSYQWQRNGAAISGATGTSYTTAATTLADNGAVYSVVVTNAAASVTSANATLTVAAVAVAPTIATAPQSTAVSVGQVASFSAGATGTAPFSYQWRRNGVDISGANSASYTTPAVTAADNSATYSVRVTNSVGAQTSANAVLTVNAATSGLIGKAWATGQALEADDNEVLASDQVIDDAGRITSVFMKWNGTRWVLYATRGTPNGAGLAPTWTTPVAIDLLASLPTQGWTRYDYKFEVTGAPNGNVLAVWSGTAPCTASSYRTSGSCEFVYTSRYLPTAGIWEAPKAVADSPNGYFAQPHINNNGDVALIVSGWTRATGYPYYKTSEAASWKANGALAFQQKAFIDSDIASFAFGMDATGNMLLGAAVKQNATVDIVAYRGSLAGGFGAAQILDTRGSAVTLKQQAVGNSGQQIILWSQNNGVRETLYAASSASATAAFDVKDLGVAWSSPALTIDDAGNGILASLDSGKRLQWTAGAWASPQALPPTPCPTYITFVFNRNGDYLCVTSDGKWGSYDAGRNVVVQAASSTAAGYVLGVSKSAGFRIPVLSVNGNGFIHMRNQYDVLPTPAAAAGDGRDVTSLWGAFLK
jgi:hypothetical protein